MRSEAESTEYVTTSYEASPPRRRDFWRVLLGRWKPTVRRVQRLTLKGWDRELRRVWNTETMEAQMLEESPLVEIVTGTPDPRLDGAPIQHIIYDETAPPGKVYLRRRDDEPNWHKATFGVQPTSHCVYPASCTELGACRLARDLGRPTDVCTRVFDDAR